MEDDRENIPDAGNGDVTGGSGEAEKTVPAAEDGAKNAAGRRKYEIVTGEDGEEELVVHGIPGEEEPGDMPQYGAPGDAEEEQEQEQEGVPSAENEKDLERLREEEERQKRERIEDLAAASVGDIKAGKYFAVPDYVKRAEEIDPDNSVFACIKLVALTDGFGNFSAGDEVTAAAARAESLMTEEEKGHLSDRYGKSLKASADADRERLLSVSAENEAGKAERRSAIEPRRKMAGTRLAVALIAFVIFAVAAIVFSTQIYASEKSTMLVLTIVFGCVAVAALVVTLIFLRLFLVQDRLYRLNERNSATRTGREQDEIRALLDIKEACLSAMGVSPAGDGEGPDGKKDDIS